MTCFSSVLQAGTTAATEPTWPAVGSTIADGTVMWKVCDIRQGTTIGRIPALIDVGSGGAGWPAVSGKLLTDISSSGEFRGLKAVNGAPPNNQVLITADAQMLADYINKALNGQVQPVTNLTIQAPSLPAATKQIVERITRTIPRCRLWPLKRRIEL